MSFLYLSFHWLNISETFQGPFINTNKATFAFRFPLKVNATFVPPTSPTGRPNTPRSPSQAGSPARPPARRHRALAVPPQHPPGCLQAPSPEIVLKAERAARARTSSNPSWWRWSAAAWSPAKPWGSCSTRRRLTPLIKCWPTSLRPSSWTLGPSRGCTHWTGNRWVQCHVTSK